MNRIKHFMILALALTLSLGAWAQGQQEVLLTTVTATGQTTYSQSPDGIVTVTLVNTYEYYDTWGWMSGSVTVEALQGYTITRCVFKQNPGGNPNRMLADDLAPFTATIDEDDYHLHAATSTGDVIGGYYMDGVSSIEVYGYEPDPYAPALDETTGHWNFLMPGSNKVVKAVLYDSIVLGPHVELYDADPAFAAGDIYTRGDSTIYYYDTNNHHSFYLRADEQADGKYFGFWADLDPTDYYYTDRTYRRVSTGSFTCGQRFTAAYLENHTLTLVTPQGGGTLSLDGVIPGETTYNITIDGNTYTNVTFPFQNMVFLQEDLDEVYNEGLSPLSIDQQVGNYVVITISEPYDGGRTIQYSCGAGEGGAKTIFCTVVQGDPIMPYGISKTGDNTYSVMEGLTVNVTATPDPAHYLSAIGNEAVISNSAYNYSITMPDEDTELAATFEAKPTLTLASNDIDQGLLLIRNERPFSSLSIGDTLRPGDYITGISSILFEGNVLYNGEIHAFYNNGYGCGNVLLDYNCELSFFNGAYLLRPAIDADHPGNAWVVYNITGSDLILSSTIASSQPIVNNVTASTPVGPGTDVTIVALPADNHHLQSWSNGYNSTSTTQSITMGTADSSVTAIFDLNPFQVAARANRAVGGTVSAQYSDYPDGTAATEAAAASISFVANPHLPITLTATPAEGFHFTCWTSAAGDTLGTGITLSVTDDADVVAVFDINTYTVTLAANNGQMGSVAIESVVGPANNIGDITLYESNQTTSINTPTYTASYYNFTRSQYIIPAADLADIPAGTSITGLKYYLRKQGTTFPVTTPVPVDVYMAEVESATYTSSSPYPIAKETSTMVHQGTLSVGDAGEQGEMTIEFSQPYIYNGGDLVIGMENSEKSNTGIAPLSFYSTNFSGVRCMVYGSNSTYENLGKSWGSYRPMTTLSYVGNSVTDNGDGTYTVAHGTQLTLKATPDPAHYLANFDGTDVRNDNDTATKVYTITSDLTATANFAAKPRLTLAHNQGGEMEIVPADNVTASTEPNTYYIDYNTDVTVKATPSDTAYLVRFDQDADTNSNTAVEKTYGPLTAALTTAEATFNAKPVLTLAHNQGGEMEIVPADNVTASTEPNTYYIDYNTEVTVKATPSDTAYLVRFDQDADTNSNTAVEKTYGPLTAALTTAEATFNAKPVLTLAQGRALVSDDPDAWGNVTLGGDDLPAGVAQLTDSTYRVDYGTSVTVVAVPDTVHYLVRFDNDADTNSNVAVEKTYQNITADVTSEALFAPKPLLTLAKTRTMEATDDWGSVSFNPLQYPYLGTSENTGPLFLTDEPDVYAVDYGATVTVTATATDLHHVANWVNEDSVAYPAADITYSAYFITEPEPLFPDSSTLTLTLTADATAKAVFGINSYDVTASVAPTTDERGTVRIASTDVQGAAQVSDSLATVTATAQGGSTSTLTAYPAWGYHFVEWQNQNGTQVSTDNPLAVTSAVDTALVAVFDTTKAELAWSDESFTGYTMIDFNNWAPTLTNSHNVEVRYGCVEGTLNVDAQSGIVGYEVAYGHIAHTPNTFHIYAVHDLSQEYFYDSVVYTLTVERGTIVNLSQNIETGGTAVFADQDSLPTLTHHYASGIMAFVAHGHTVDLVAEPAEGYHFTAWQEGDLVSGYTDIATSLEYTYTVPDATAAGLKAVFDTTKAELAWSDESFTGYTFVDFNAFKPTLSNPHNVEVRLGVVEESLDFDAENYVIGEENSYGHTVGATGTYHVYAVHDLSQEYFYDSVAYTLNVEQGVIVNLQKNIETGGMAVFPEYSETGSATLQYLSEKMVVVGHGQTVTVDAAPETGYHFTQWQARTTGAYTYVSDETPYSYSVPMAFAVGIQAVFDTNVYNMNIVAATDNREVGTDTAMGSVTGPATVKHFHSGTYVATPYYGYRFLNWQNAAGEVVSELDTIEVVPVSDTALTAVFGYDRYAITAVSANAQLGSVEGSDTVDYLEPVSLTATPDYGYRFDNWTNANGDTLGSEPTLEVIALRDSVITANFVIDEFVVTAQSADALMGTATGTATADYMAEVTLKATPETGYHFVNWTEADTLYSVEDSITVVANASRTFTANFDTNVYNVAIAVAESSEGRGTVENTPMEVKHFLNATYTATPEYGYHFAGWMNAADSVVSTGNPLVLSPVSDTALSAVFDTNAYVLTVAVAEGQSHMATTQGSDSAARQFRNYEIGVTPEYGYYFVAWNDGNTENPRTVTLTSDSTFTASFEAHTYVLTLAKDENLGYITLEGAGNGENLNLAEVTADTVVADGTTLYGTLGANVKVSIAEGATVTLDGVTINGLSNIQYNWAGITCLGDATIILDGENSVRGFYENYPGIYVPEGSTLTIEGRGSLTVNGSVYGAGIGGGLETACGNIVIAGGTVNATGGSGSAAIGSGNNASCGDITISGGHVTANCGEYAAGIGSGMMGSCGTITIASGVTAIHADKGVNANTIGKGFGGSVAAVIVNGTTGAITTSPYSYEGDGTGWTNDGLPTGVTNNHDGTYTVVYNTEVNVIAKAIEHYHVERWSNEAEVTTLNPDTIAVTVTKDSTIMVYFGYNSIAGDTTAVACNQFTWHGVTYTETPAENPTYVYHLDNGYDSVVTLHLTIVSRYTNHEYVTNCGPYTWEANGRTYNKTGVKTFKHYAEDGCPIYDTLTLTVGYGRTSHKYVENCGPYTWDVNGRTYNLTGVKTFKSYTEEGCPNYDTLTLTVKAAGRISHEYVENCGPYTWDVNGQTYNQTGVKTFKSYNEAGCPNYDTLTLTVKTAGRTSHEHVEHCGPYTWDVNGRTYNQTGVKTFKSYNEAGCPNYDTLTLTVVSRYTNHEYVEHCGPYTWDVTGKTYNKSGVKTYKHYAEDGCPVYDTLTLTVNNCEPSDNGENFGLGESDALTQMTVYPNPTTGRLQINAAEVNKVEVLDMVGRCVAVFENTLTIDLSNLAASTYTLRVTMPEGVALRKVVKR